MGTTVLIASTLSDTSAIMETMMETKMEADKQTVALLPREAK